MSGGKLIVVPTPVGNLGDMTPRALEVLKEAMPSWQKTPAPRENSCGTLASTPHFGRFTNTTSTVL